MNSGPSIGTCIAVGVGGMAGGVFRLLASSIWPAAAGGLPLSLLAINAVGSALIGLVFAFSEPGGRLRLSPAISLGLMAGFCGAMTTFSAFAVETLALLAEPALAAAHGLLSLTCWLAAAVLGLLAGRRLNAPATAAGPNDE